MKRTESIDLLRGLIMIFMALDHASAMVGRMHFTEIWGVAPADYPTLVWWFTRFISHLCAPGFFFLMGMSVLLFSQKRLEANWTKGQISRYFLKRGSFILVLMFLVEFPAWGLGFAFDQTASTEMDMPGNPDAAFLPSTVLYGLGTVLIIAGLLWPLAKKWLLAITVGCFALSAVYIANSDPNDSFWFWEHLFLVPGMSGSVMTLYPIIPWLGVATFGILWGKLLQERGPQLFSLSWKVGLAFLLVAIGLRAAHFGNLGQENYTDWISFFTLVKYPPSLIFFLTTCGINLLLLAMFHKLGTRTWLRPVKIFGQTAMFFYLIHLYFYAAVGAFFPLGCPVYIMYLIWAVGLIPLFFMSKRFLAFKQGKGMDSLWRML